MLELVWMHVLLWQHVTDKKDLTGGINAFMFLLLDDLQCQELEAIPTMLDSITLGEVVPNFADTQQKSDCPVMFLKDLHEGTASTLMWI